MTGERNLLDYAYVLLKWRRMIVASVLGVALAAAGVSLVLPPRWTARTTLLPPEEDGGQMWLSSVLASNVPPNLGRLMGSGGSSERLLTILGSQRVLGAVVDSFALVREYGASSRELAILMLDESTRRELGQDGALGLEVTAASPQLAADLANALAAELDQVNRHYRSQQARALREFLQQRVEVVRTETEAAGTRLRIFQEKHRLVDVEAQAAAALDVIKGVAQELALKQVELGMSARLLGPEHEQRRRDLMETEELQRQLALLVGEAGSAPPAAASPGLGPALLQLPELGQEYAQLRLELEVKERVLAYLRAQLEETRYREARDTPTLLVLDPAVPPTYRSAPRRTLIVLGAAAVAAVCSVVLAFLLESLGPLAAANEPRLRAIRELFGRAR